MTMSASASLSPGGRRRRRRERWLVALGVALHAVYMLSIFDIYFKTPIVHGMDPVHPTFPAPARRLILLVGSLRFQFPISYFSMDTCMHAYIHYWLSNKYISRLLTSSLSLALFYS
jgi:hypothetical protein